MNRDLNACRYRWSNGSKNFQEHLELLSSEQNSRFQVVFDRLRINQYSIDWSEVEVIDKSAALLGFPHLGSWGRGSSWPLRTA
ncbi:hypothetical protein AHAS_Ahas11G0198100 [Arachis hypogaea]